MKEANMKNKASLTITPATESDLPGIMTVEKSGFDPTLAASEDTYRDRIRAFPDTCLVAREGEAGRIVGVICGPVVQGRFIEDRMYEVSTPNPPSGGHQMILSLAVLPECRRHGVGGSLLAALEREARTRGRLSVALTCLRDLVAYYRRFGYVDAGEADSSHGGRSWRNMERML